MAKIDRSAILRNLRREINDLRDFENNPPVGGLPARFKEMEQAIRQALVNLEAAFRTANDSSIGTLCAQIHDVERYILVDMQRIARTMPKLLGGPSGKALNDLIAAALETNRQLEVYEKLRKAA